MKSWKATPKRQCTKCQVVFDKDWTSSDGSCPSCHALACHQRILKASDSRERRFTPVTDLQKRIMIAESRLQELYSQRQRHENTAVVQLSASGAGKMGEEVDELRTRHTRDLIRLREYQHEIVQTTMYLSELKVKLKNMVEHLKSQTSMLTTGGQ